MKTILLIGDSWACGEWQSVEAGSITLAHPGMTEYLKTDYNYNVLNLSRSGNSPWQIVYTLHNFLTQKKARLTDDFEIVVFQTDPVRPVLHEKLSVNLEEIYSNVDNLESLYTELTEIFYIKVAETAKRFDKKIYLAGGLTDVDTELLNLYPECQVLCQSWVQLINPDHTPSVMPLQIDSNTLTQAKKYNRIDLCDSIVNHSNQKFLELQEMLESKYFGPVYGDFHPSRDGHKLMSDFIHNFFKSQK
jgi:hypothetical protein